MDVSAPFPSLAGLMARNAKASRKMKHPSGKPRSRVPLTIPEIPSSRLASSQALWSLIGERPASTHVPLVICWNCGASDVHSGFRDLIAPFPRAANAIPMKSLLPWKTKQPSGPSCVLVRVAVMSGLPKVLAAVSQVDFSFMGNIPRSPHVPLEISENSDGGVGLGAGVVVGLVGVGLGDGAWPGTTEQMGVRGFPWMTVAPFPALLGLTFKNTRVPLTTKQPSGALTSVVCLTVLPIPKASLASLQSLASLTGNMPESTQLPVVISWNSRGGVGVGVGVVGVGAGDGTTPPTKSRRLGELAPTSVILSFVDCDLIRSSTSLGVRLVSCPRRSAAAPDTCGHAIEVPLKNALSLSDPIPAEGMRPPGAKTSTQLPMLEKLDLASLNLGSPIEPTVMAAGTPAGV